MHATASLYRRLLSSSSIVSACLASSAVLIAGAAAAAPAPNVTTPDADILTLLAPFQTLPSTAAGQATLATNITAAVATNNAAAKSASVEATSISDKTIFGTANGAGIYASIVLPSASGTHTPPTGAAPADSVVVTTYGPGANLGGGLPVQNIQNGTVNGATTGTVVAGTIAPSQTLGGFGQLSAAFQSAEQVGGAATLPSLVSLLNNAYASNSSALGIAKFFEANGTTSGVTPVVLPSGYTVTGGAGGANSPYDSYYLAHGYAYNTNIGPNIYGDTRPVQFTSTSGANDIVYDPQAIIGLTTNPAFPSGHTTYAYTDSILLGMLTPQYFQSMLLRGSEYANSRIDLGVHYPLDIIASRSFVQYSLAQLLNATSDSPYFYTNAVGSTTPISGTGLNANFVTAAAQFNGYLNGYVTNNATTLGCASVAGCAATNSYNSYSASTYAYQGASNSAIFDYRQNYGLPTLSLTAAPTEAAAAGGPDASILLTTLYGGQGNVQAQALANAVTGGSSGAGVYANLTTGSIDQIIQNTETQALTAFYGTSLSYWSRIDLYDAAGYFSNIQGTLQLASTDTVFTGATVGATGVLAGTGTVVGTVTNTAGGTVSPGPVGGVGTLTVGAYTQGANSTLAINLTPAGSSSLNVAGAVALNGALNINYAAGTYGVATVAPIVTSGSKAITGTFSSVNQTGQSAGYASGVYYKADNSQVNLVVEQTAGAQAFGAVTTATLDEARGLASIVQDKIGCANGPNIQTGQAASAAPRSCEGASAWAQFIGTTERTTGGGFATADNTALGIVGGIDQRWNGGTLGVAFGYTDNILRLNQIATKASGSSYFGSLYGGTTLGPVQVNAQAFYMHSDWTLHRYLGGYGTAASSPGGSTYGGLLEVTTPFDNARPLRPYARVIVAEFDRDATAESGVGPLGFNAASQDTNATLGEFGLELTHIWGEGAETQVMPTLRVGVQQYFSSPNRGVAASLEGVSNPTTFTVDSVKPSETAGVGDGQLKVKVTDRVDFIGELRGRFSGNQTEGAASLGAALRF